MPLGAWLADLPDERLIRLLAVRPDLTQPPPGTIAALAARAQARQSVKAATDELDFLRLAVLDALLMLHADTAAIPLTKLLELIGDRASEETVTAAIDDLRERALVWGDTTVRVAPEAASSLPWSPGQAIVEVDQSPDGIADRLAGADEAQLELLRKLLEGSPMGRTRDAAPGTPPDRPVQRLLAAGLLRQLDADTVILPRLVGQVLRGELPGPVALTEPDPAISTTTVADVDAVAAGAVIDLLRETELVLETLGATPVPELRSGGLGVRDVKRLTKVTGIDERRLGLILEVASAAGLIAVGLPEPEPPDGAGPYWAPTVAADRFVESPTAFKWHLLASTWLDLPGRPGPDRQPRPRRQTLCGAVGFAVLHRRTAGPAAAARRAGRPAAGRRRECCRGVAGDDLAATPLGGAAAAGSGRRPADGGARDWAWWAAARLPHRPDACSRVIRQMTSSRRWPRCCRSRSTTSCCRPT